MWGGGLRLFRESGPIKNLPEYRVKIGRSVTVYRPSGHSFGVPPKCYRARVGPVEPPPVLPSGPTTPQLKVETKETMLTSQLRVPRLWGPLKVLERFVHLSRQEGLTPVTPFTVVFEDLILLCR